MDNKEAGTLKWPLATDVVMKNMAIYLEDGGILLLQRNEKGEWVDEEGKVYHVKLG